MRTHRVSATPTMRAAIALAVYTVLMLSVSRLSWTVYQASGDPNQRPLFHAADRFADLTNYRDKTRHLRHQSGVLGGPGSMFNYPPPAAFVYKALLYTYPRHPAIPFIAFLAICNLAFGFVAFRACRGRTWAGLAAVAAILATVACASPLWFDADRGNIEGVAWALATAGLCFLLRSRYRAAAVLIGLAATVKPYPILFLLLLVRRGRYRESLLGGAIAAAATLAALVILGPNPLKAYQDLKPGVDRYTATYVENIGDVDQVRFQHSLLDGAKLTALAWESGSASPERLSEAVERVRVEPGGWATAHTLVRVYPFVAVAALAWIFAVFRKAPMLNQLTAIAVVTTLLPPVAAEYTLLGLYAAFGGFLVFLTREVAPGRAPMRFRSMLALAVFYALLFAPTTVLGIYAGDAKMLLLIALLVVVARTPMPCEYFGDPMNRPAAGYPPAAITNAASLA